MADNLSFPSPIETTAWPSEKFVNRLYWGGTRIFPVLSARPSTHLGRWRGSFGSGGNCFEIRQTPSENVIKGYSHSKAIFSDLSMQRFFPLSCTTASPSPNDPATSY